ncbi:DUF4123 domain-containing protein [Halopseudomonas phragmitis]|uniref:DUF4123 domain-containing protein n=1 Tax=Halopseudomonas phragmitis TaxID=1931241 RepID=A0A1V0B130_9GAMM|nr:DUF4123 domain-containing protein [Halopseudomonas phragmitis]AQZ93484.1 hypothetical protein BVH74_01300 [Halopseudomonas phragmitis]
MSLIRHSELPLIAGPLYWLAEPQEGLMESVYQHEPDPSPEYLFDQTPWSRLREQGPLLFRLSERGGLLAALREDPGRLNGILLIGSSSPDEVLSHLRALLHVDFGQQRKAIMRYYDPVVASYLWPAVSSEELPRWMGPLRQIFWFGGTWADRAEQSLSWHEVLQVSAKETSAGLPVFNLSESQQTALARQGVERFAFDWLNNHSAEPFARLIRRIEQGLAVGHDEQDTLSAWLEDPASQLMEHHG